MSDDNEESGKAVLLERVVRLRTIELSDAVRQDKTPVAFMVFCHRDIDHDYMIFPEESEARDYAMEQEEKANAPEDSWPIYALWASEWPNADIRRGA